MERLKNLDRLSEEVKKRTVPYAEEMLELHGEKIISMLIYGSATGRDFNPRSSDVNMLVIFDMLDFSELKKSLKLISRGIQQRITAPLFLTRRHLETSTDTFPIEFLEMKENHLLIYGEDVVSGLKINSKHIRLQCEQQLKGKLIRLRQAYLEIGLKKRGMEVLLKESFASLIPVFRNMLRLKGKEPPVEKEAIIGELSKEFAVDGDLFLALLRDKQNDEKIGSQNTESFFERYIEEIRKLAKASDELI